MADTKRIVRLKQVESVLFRTLLMNLTVAVIKIVIGLLTGITAVLADGFHSIGDTLSNIIGMLGVRMSRRDPDSRFSYGYDRFESVATLAITGLILVTFLFVLKQGVEKLLHPSDFTLTTISIVMLACSMTINGLVVWYEGRAGRRLNSDLLIADSNETKSDIIVTAGVLTGVGLMKVFPSLAFLDGVLALMVAAMIGHVLWEIVQETAAVLADAQVVDPHEVYNIVMAVLGVRFCHAIRSRGRESGFFLDLHVGVPVGMTIEEAHNVVCHNVKIALHDRWHHLKSANIHLEPDDENGRGRKNSVFVRRDPYGHNGNGI